MDISDYVNEPAPTSSLGSVSDFVLAAEELSPADQFRKSLADILNFGTAELLGGNDFVGRLLLVGLVSAVEDYVRSMISGIVNVCPISREKVADKSVSLGSVIWHTTGRYSRSALEHSSLAEEKGLKSAIKEYFGIELPASDFAGLLKDYDRICQIRHGIVHASGFLPGKNAIKLELVRSEYPLLIVIRYKQLQDSAAVLYGLVRSLNRFIFLTLCRRWAQDWRRRGDWTATDEDILFSKIWSLCLCRSELSTRPGRSKITKSLCMAKVKSDLLAK